MFKIKEESFFASWTACFASILAFSLYSFPEWPLILCNLTVKQREKILCLILLMMESLLALSHRLGENEFLSESFMLSIAAWESVNRSILVWGGITRSLVHMASNSALVEDGQLIVAIL